MIHTLACRFATLYTQVSRAPITILLLVPVGVTILLIGWELDVFNATMLALTTALSFDASLISRCVALKQASDAGEVELEA